MQTRLATLDAALAGYAADPDAAAELGRTLRAALVMGGHPVGYHMASVILRSLGRERLLRRIADPFDFVRAYDEAARTDPERHHVFTPEALRGLSLLERRVLP